MSAKKHGARVEQPNVSPEMATRYLSEVKGEFRKVTWTSRDELKVYTKVVLISTFLFGLGIYFADLLVQGALQGVATLARLIAG